MLLFTSIYSTGKCGLGLISILAFIQYWQHILNETAVTYNLKTHADDGLLITWSSDNINTCSGEQISPPSDLRGWDGIIPRTVVCVCVLSQRYMLLNLNLIPAFQIIKMRLRKPN